MPYTPSNTSSTRAPKTPADWSVARPTPPIGIAYLEAALLHARVLSEFLTADETRPRFRDDVLRDRLRESVVGEARRRLIARHRLPGGDEGCARRRATSDRAVILANKHLVHLTWARASSARYATAADNIEWLFVEIVRDVATILRGWFAHAFDEMPRSPKMDLYSVPYPPSVAEVLLELVR